MKQMGQGVQRFSKEGIVKFGVALMGLLWLCLVAAAWAEQEANAAEGREGASTANREASEDDEYNFNWLDPEKKIYVLQNRKFLKSGKLELSLLGGLGFSNPYRSTWNIDPRAAYFMNESWGFEVFYTYTSNSANSSFSALQTALTSTTVSPAVREITGQFGALLKWAPWYAKINVFNKILYFDWYFTAGGGSISYNYLSFPTGINGAVLNSPQTAFGIFLGTGHEFHLTNRFFARIDVTGAYYRSPVISPANGVSESAWFSNYNFGAGVGLKL